MIVRVLDISLPEPEWQRELARLERDLAADAEKEQRALQRLGEAIREAKRQRRALSSWFWT